MALDLSSLQKAVGSLDRTLNAACSTEKMAVLDDAQKDAIRAGVIQNFEFTYELCWKFIQRWLGNNLGSSYVAGVSRRELFRLAAERGLIDDIDLWMEYHDARNKTSHIYNENVAEEVFSVAKKFAADAGKFLKIIEEKND